MPGSEGQQAWGTAGYRPEAQFAVWQQIVAEAFLPLTVNPLPGPGEGFAAECGARAVGDLRLLGLSAQGHSVERTAAQVAARPTGMYFLNLLVLGSWSAWHDGRRATAGADELVLIDGDRPFRLEFSGVLSQLVLEIPRPLLDPLLACPAAGVGVRVRGDAGAGALVAAVLRALAEHADALTARQARVTTRHLLGLVAMAVCEASPRPPRGRALLLQQAVEEAERTLDDPDLTAHQLARRLCISTSYLTKLFAERGLSFGRWLLGRRLDRAWDELAPEVRDGRTITEVAFACGFRDSAHFARTFRARFGTTPSGRATMGA